MTWGVVTMFFVLAKCVYSCSIRISARKWRGAAWRRSCMVRMNWIGLGVVVWIAVSWCAVGAGCGDTGGTGSSGMSTSGASSGTGSSTSSGSASSGGQGGSGQGGGGTGGSASGTGGMGSGGMGSGGSGGGNPKGLASLKTLVVLGDSISDGGGQSPFYYNLLRTDLEAKYGSLAYYRKAQSGSKTGALVNQIQSLPGSMPGPVAVVITSGGNDMKDALAQVILGLDGPAKATMGANVKAALDLLLTPNKYGPGVEVYVFEGNIYDASDGAGDFGQHNCNFGNGIPAIPTDGFFMGWNQVIADQVNAHGQVQADMHAHFYGHGYKSSPNWYASDCTHPSSVGHDQLRRLFYQKITGEALP